MLLSDRDLYALLDQLNIETEDISRPFDASSQVQPCSIDLRLDLVFWKARKPRLGNKIDLRLGGAGEINMARRYRIHHADEKEGVTISPGEMLLARTYEKFEIPNGYAGKIEGRSSYARMGLSIHCTGDFINPGWRGHMPLQLVNHGHVPIIVTPYVLIAQLLVLQTSTTSEKPYGSSDGAGHKYVDDNGGPSKYWLDRSLIKLQDSFGHRNLPDEMKEEFLRVIGRDDPELMDRFSYFIDALPNSQVTG